MDENNVQQTQAQPAANPPEMTAIKPVEQAAAPAEKASTEKPAEQAKPKKAPRLFFKENDRILVTINGYHNNETGELAFVTPEEDDTNSLDSSLDGMFTKVAYKFWFTRCTYDKLNRYRGRSMIYNSEDQNNTLNEIRLREFFLVLHLVDWNITDENGDKIKLKFDTNKTLSDESLKIAYALPPSLLDAALVSYERKMGIISKDRAGMKKGMDQNDPSLFVDPCHRLQTIISSSRRPFWRTWRVSPQGTCPCRHTSFRTRTASSSASRDTRP